MKGKKLKCVISVNWDIDFLHWHRLSWIYWTFSTEVQLRNSHWSVSQLVQGSGWVLVNNGCWLFKNQVLGFGIGLHQNKTSFHKGEIQALLFIAQIIEEKSKSRPQNYSLL